MRRVFTEMSLRVSVRSDDDSVDTEALVRDVRERCRVALGRVAEEFAAFCESNGLDMVQQEFPIREAD